ncbi:MAG: hypothetical protein M3R68_05760 [Acidobacteriota bacterium]|nr:hypothetical protein [Acidobacteriota bacterium]
MKPNSMRLAFPAVLFLIAHTALAQISAGTKAFHAIEFRPGMKTAVVKGSVSPSKTVGPDMTNDGFETYSLRSSAGHHLTMEISSDDHQAMFSLVKPSPGGAKHEFVEKAARVKRWSGTLAMTGDYRITVFTREQEGVSRFKLRVTLR